MKEACEKLEGRTNSSTIMATSDEFFPGMNLEASNRNKGQSSRPMTSITTLEVKLEIIINTYLTYKRIQSLQDFCQIGGIQVTVRK